MAAPLIRPYRASDRTAVFRIAADTAFFGEPVEAFLEDRDLFCDAFYRYYTDLEPEHGWVACVEETVVGFLMGCTDTLRQGRRLAWQILPETLGQILRGRYRIGPLTRRYLLRAGLSALRGEVFQADLKTYPAHLHVNLEASWRGHGLGRRLIETYLDQLRGLAICGVHLHTANLNTAACRLYEQLGFRVIDTRPTRRLAYRLAQPLQNLCYAQRLAPNSETGFVPGR
jgi:ribosomal protein S18 acetylase RimI-like enzyme